MKKTLLAVLLSGFSLGAFAQQQGFVAPSDQEYSQGGFSGSTRGLSSVAQTKTLRDGARVILEGNIIKQVEHERYEFRDASGTIYLDIDEERWMGQTASSKTKVRIEGEVDKDRNSFEIDVKNLQILK